ncbi:NAD(P)/FAD-dependent oxidoreductase [Roseicyclus persicicus]|uniref:FAD-dependent oxidoreductase n=1 Tax=Roseicyclus persicicus TaxID=2650661 RepID=A0A7X6JXA6_9RHOB|nr:FAD-dependent oxidoreductase [Roseibacterium persicicum]NKX45327.1 FAD-dependent oxidoreductase [Roseibacterium persicicum]
MGTVDVAVVGRGLMGTACARHLAGAGLRVALVGPDEPADRAAHDGPFGSFHDAGRITRAIAQDPVWARLATRSIARYAELEARGGLPFYNARGGLMAGPATGPMAGFTAGVLDTSARLGLRHELLAGPTLAARFPMFRLPGDGVAVLDPVGGVIDPRAMRLAEERLAVAAGAEVIATHAVARDGATLALADGGRVSADHVVLATGGWAAAQPLTGARPAMRVYQRTVLFAEVTEAEAARLSDMPSLIWVPEGSDTDLYLLPPVRYPDGRLRLKIGGEADSPEARDGAALNAWFRTEGSAAAGAALRDALTTLMPDLAIAGTSTGACAVSFTETGYPYIARLDAHVTLLTGGNGAAAKCADELGRLGALAALGGDVAAEGLGTDFGPVFA